MSGLEPLGLAGPAALKELLTTCTDPIEAITNFQSQNSIRQSSLAPALKLLDLHNVRRLEYHEIMSNDLRERLMTKIRETAATATASGTTNSARKTSTKRLEDLIEKSFPLVNVPQLRLVVLETLKYMTKIPNTYLTKIMNDVNLYNDVAVEVKQQIWEQQEELFLKELRPVIDDYLAQKQKYFTTLDTCLPGYFVESSKIRRQSKFVQSLVNMVGRNVTLYDRCLQYVRETFLDTKCVHLCSLRSELLMALHDADVQELINLDPCHKFAWCLDACLREKHLDPKHAAELKGVLDGIKRGKEQILGDLAMIAGDPHTLHFLSQLISKVLTQCLTNESLPRDHSALQLVLRLLSVGLNAWQMHSQGEYKEPKIDSIIYTKFLSSLMILMCKDQCRLMSEKISETSNYLEEPFSSPPQSGGSSTDELTKNKTFDEPLSENLVAFFKSDALCCFLTLYYALELTKKKDAVGLTKILPIMSRSYNDLAYLETYLHVFVWHASTSLADALANRDDLFDALFAQFLFKKTVDYKVKCQTMKLAYFCASKLTKIKRDYLLEYFLTSTTSGADQSSATPEWYANVLEQVTKKFNDVGVEKEIDQQPAPISNLQHSLSFDFPDVPTPMMNTNLI